MPEKLFIIMEVVDVDEGKVKDGINLRNAERVTVGSAISLEELNRRRYAVQAGEARLAQAKYNLELLEAGVEAGSRLSQG